MAERLWRSGPARAANPDRLTVDENAISDTDRRSLKFGIRQVTYEPVADGRPDRPSPTASKPISPRAMSSDSAHPRRAVTRRFTRLPPAGGEAATWAPSLMPEAQGTAAVTAVTPDHDPRLSNPYLVHQGQRNVRHRGARRIVGHGRLGMKRSRALERLEPYFKPATARLARQHHPQLGRPEHRGQPSTTWPTRYGLMVLNDFWESTQEYQLEAQDNVPLFMKNAKDDGRSPGTATTRRSSLSGSAAMKACRSRC